VAFVALRTHRWAELCPHAVSYPFWARVVVRTQRWGRFCGFALSSSSSVPYPAMGWVLPWSSSYPFAGFVSSSLSSVLRWAGFCARAVFYPSVGFALSSSPSVTGDELGASLPCPSSIRVLEPCCRLPTRCSFAFVDGAAVSPPFADGGFRTSALGSPQRCGLPYLGARLPTSTWGFLPRRSTLWR
jgi:hypothetical protein